MSQDLPPPKSWWHGWRGLGLIVLVLLFFTVGVGTWWWNDDSDLAEVRALAEANNIAIEWRDDPNRTLDEQRLGIWHRIVALEKRLPAYANKKPSGSPLYKSFAPIPEEMRAFHASLDTKALADLSVALEELGDQPLILHAEIDFHTKMEELSTYRNLMKLLRERAALADSTGASRLCREQITLCRGFADDSALLHAVRVSLVNSALDSITERLGEFKATDPHLAEAILTTTEPLPSDLSRALTGEFRCCYQLCAQRTFQMKGWGWITRPLVKIGRRSLLETHIRGIVETRSGALDPPMAWARAQEAQLAVARSGIPTPTLILGGVLNPAYSTVISFTHEAVLKGRLIAAELKGEPWPIDVFDPARKPLRPVLRDGKIIGAYTVGKDGIDDGGDKKKDRYFPLYGPLEPPVSAGP